MRITRIDNQLLNVPCGRPRASPTEAAAGKSNHIVVLLVHVRTDSGLDGLGFAYALQGSGRALLAIAQDDLTPLLLGEDPLEHARLEAKAFLRLQTLGKGLTRQAYSAFDVGLWDLKGKAAGMPLFRLLGGARESSAVYGSDTGWLWMSPEEIIEASEPYLEQGMMGIKIKVGADPESDAQRLTQLREAWGDEVWLGVDANQRYDYPTALAMGHFFEEDVGADWFEEPIHSDNIGGHARLASQLEIPIAAGEMLFDRDEFRDYLERNALGVLQPDVTRLGGITGFLKVAALGDLYHLPLAPHLLPEISVHLACGLPGVTAVEYMPWLYPLFQNPPQVHKGRLVPPDQPGLGLELNMDAVIKYRVA